MHAECLQEHFMPKRKNYVCKVRGSGASHTGSAAVDLTILSDCYHVDFESCGQNSCYRN